MPCRSRPLFLIPSLMARPSVEMTLLDLGSEGAIARPDGKVVDTASAMRRALEPLLVDLNLAGYEVLAIVASAGPDGSAPCYYDSLSTGLIAPELESWNDIVQGPQLAWGEVRAALALQVVPRLALREELTEQGSVLPSSYGAALTLPAAWSGTIDRNSGGWIIATSDRVIAPPKGYLDVVGALKPGTSAYDLQLAVRDAVASAWSAHVPAIGSSWTPAALGATGLAPLFDPRAWAFTPGDEAGPAFADLVDTFVYRQAIPSYADLARYTLRELLAIAVPGAVAERYIEEAVAKFRGELMRREIIDVASIDAASFTDRTLGPRVLSLFAGLDGFGSRAFALDLFLLLELGLIALRERADDEEALPVVIAREWTAVNLTGRYDEVVPAIGIAVDALADPATASPWFELVASHSNAIALNQAGTHLEGFWQERAFVAGEPVKLHTWHISGDVAGDDPLVYSVEFTFSGTISHSTLVFNADATELTADWEGTQWTFKRMTEMSRLAMRGVDTLSVPATPLITPHMNDAELDSFAPDVAKVVRARERSWLSTAEIELLDATVERLRFDLEWIAQQPTTDHLINGLFLCQHFTAAFGYFFVPAAGGGGTPALESEHCVLARFYIKQRLLAMLGNDSPLDPASGTPPATYWHALAAAMSGVACPAINVGLDLPSTEIASILGKQHSYRWKFRTDVSGVTDRLVKKAFPTLDKVATDLLRGLIKRGIYVLTRIDDVEFGLSPDVQLDLIEAEFQKIKPYDATTPWPGTEDHPESVFYVGFISGLGVSLSAGINLEFESEWSTVETQNVEWTPDDFAGPFAGFGLAMGWSLFGVERLFEASLGWIWERLGYSDFRTWGEFSYIQFMSEGKEDVGAVLVFSWTNTWGAHIGVGVSATGGYLWRTSGPDDTSVKPVPDLVIDSVRWQNSALELDDRISFDVGRSELNEDGAALLRKVAATYLYELAGPSSTLVITGHTSPDDARALYNQTLSERRAENVVRYLKAYLGPMFNITPQRTLCRGLGQAESELHPGDDPADWRKVDVHLNGRLAVRMIAL